MDTDNFKIDEQKNKEDGSFGFKFSEKKPMETKLKETKPKEIKLKETKFKTESDNKERHKNSSLDKSVTLKLTFSPRKTIKWLVIVMLFVCIFYLGRVSVGSSCSDSTIVLPAEKAESTIGEVSSGIAGFFKSLFSGKSEENANNDSATGSIVVESASTNSTPSLENTTAVVTVSTPTALTSTIIPTSSDDETIITTYTKVAVSLGPVSVDWKDTWGKIKSFQFTIKNSEDGTIKPDYFIMNVEGYADFDKKVPLPASAKIIKAGVTATSSATVPSGFAYNELTAGDLSGVEITLILYDASGKEMGTLKKSVDLTG